MELAPSLSPPLAPRNMKRVVWVCLLALVVGLARARAVSPGFDLLLLVRSYQPGFCAHQHCTHTPRPVLRVEMDDVTECM